DTITIELENDGQMQQEDEIGLYPYPDAGMQLSILKEIAEAIEENRGINVILEMVLEGIHRGVGMDRSMFAILSKDRKTLTCKYAIGDDNERLRDQFKIDISNPKNIFNLSISNKKARHIPSDPKMVEGTIARETLKMLGTPPYLIMPTIVKGKVIGMFIADRNASSRQIDDKDFVAFQQFCQQANMGLTFLSS
ncbi:MAG: GAF domain-containing protein, partial [Gammaproteobacteria bacterium]|nr:GAF domain-containing protein [Gammaproteobacteria bacterium]